MTFYDCINLEDVYFLGSESQKNIDISHGNEMIVDFAQWHYNTCKTEHTYTGCLDATCENCDWERNTVSEHTFDNACDATCNVCNQTREAIEHSYDNACDENCNVCSEKRKAPHVYDNSEDLICNDCGYERPPYIPGDIDGVEGITDADAEYLLMHTFFPEDYPVNQTCDFNGDGKVNDADAEHLLMFTFFPEDYPLN